MITFSGMGLERALFAFTDGDKWRPGIGDPTFMGWVTVAAYCLAALLSVAAFLEAFRSPSERSKAVFWGALACFCLLLGINKQLDLQTWLTLSVKKVAIAQGWYERRRIVQLAFVALIAVMGMAGFMVLWRLVRHHGRELILPLAGFCLLVCFVVIRAASFHHIDQLLKFSVGGVRMNWVFELTGIALVIFGALRSNQRKRGERMEPPPFAPGRLPQT